MKIIALKFIGVCALAATITATPASAAKDDICDALTNLAKKEYREKRARADKRYKEPLVQNMLGAAKLFAIRLTNVHRTYIEAGRKVMLDADRLANILNKEVCDPALEDLSAVHSIRSRNYHFVLHVSSQWRHDSMGSFLTACADANGTCITIDLFRTTDYKAEIDGEIRKYIKHPGSEVDFVRNSLPESCRNKGSDDLIDPNKIEAEESEKDAPAKSYPLTDCTKIAGTPSAMPIH